MLPCIRNQNLQDDHIKENEGAGHGIRRGEVKYTPIVLVGHLHLEGRIILKCFLQIGCKAVDWIHLAQNTV